MGGASSVLEANVLPLELASTNLLKKRGAQQFIMSFSKIHPRFRFRDVFMHGVRNLASFHNRRIELISQSTFYFAVLGSRKF